MGHGLRKRRRRYPIVIYVRHLTIDERRALEQEERRLWRAREESIAPDVVSTQEKRVRIALRSDEGWTAARIARDLGMSERTVRTWIARINETVPGALRGVDDLEDRRRSGHPTVYDAAHIADIVRALLASPDPSRDRWTLDALRAYLADHHDIGIRRARLGDILRERRIRWYAPLADTGGDRGDRGGPGRL